MAPTIQLRQGDMFAQPSDLVIIPCSTDPTIAPKVAERLEALRIEPPSDAMALGDVKFSLFKGGTSIAAYVGYAASVEDYRSNVRAIRQIATQIAEFVRDKSEIRDVSIPLLGSGAGGLSAKESAEALFSGLEKIDSANTVFNIYVYDQSDYHSLTRNIGREPRRPIARDRLKARDSIVGRTTEPAKHREPIRVFVSYTRTNDEHQKWVQEIATLLRSSGIDARLDVWHLRPGMDLPQWMCNELDLAERVLIICNREYAERADGRYGGVGWEIRLVQGDLLHTQQTNPNKYIPIVRGGFARDSVPVFLRSVNCITWPDRDNEAAAEKLVKELYGVYEQAPPLGSPPRYVII